jgi:hypothetical protein
MAVGTFIWIYAVAFGLATLIAVVLLLSAARRIGKNGQDQDKNKPTQI